MRVEGEIFHSWHGLLLEQLSRLCCRCPSQQQPVPESAARLIGSDMHADISDPSKHAMPELLESGWTMKQNQCQHES